MAKRKGANFFDYEKEEQREISRIKRVGSKDKWKFDKSNIDKYFSGDDNEYEEDTWGEQSSKV